jgi:hypothetical protein
MLAAVMDSELRHKVAEEYNLRKTQIQMNIKLAIRKRDKLAATRCCLFFSIPHLSFFSLLAQQSDDAPRRARRYLDARVGVRRGDCTPYSPRHSFLLAIFTSACY